MCNMLLKILSVIFLGLVVVVSYTETKEGS